MKSKLVYFIAFLVIIFGIISSAENVEAARRVRGYYKPKTGSYVMPHYRTKPNKTRIDNWSTKGNFNPFTGKKGHKNLPSKSMFYSKVEIL